MNDAVVVVRKVFPASRERLFRAWSDPQELIEWFSPEGFCSPSVEADIHSGGTFRIAMQKFPDGEPFLYPDDTGRSSLHPGWFSPGPGKIPLRRSAIRWLRWSFSNGKLAPKSCTHELLPEERRDSHAQGWEALLSKLQKTLDRETEGEQ